MKHGLTQMIGGRGGLLEQIPKEISKWPGRVPSGSCGLE
jgi:hypothetical protein